MGCPAIQEKWATVSRNRNRKKQPAANLFSYNGVRQLWCQSTKIRSKGAKANSLSSESYKNQLILFSIASQQVVSKIYNQSQRQTAKKNQSISSSVDHRCLKSIKHILYCMYTEISESYQKSK